MPDPPVVPGWGYPSHASWSKPREARSLPTTDLQHGFEVQITLPVHEPDRLEYRNGNSTLYSQATMVNVTKHRCYSSSMIVSTRALVRLTSASTGKRMLRPLRPPEMWISRYSPALESTTT